MKETKEIHIRPLKRGTVIKSWALSYIIIVSIPIIISTILLIYSLNIMQQETEQLCENELECLASVMDGYLSEMNHIARELSKDKNVSALVSSSSLTAREHYLFYTICQQIRNYVITNNNISQIGLILTDRDVVLINYRTSTIEMDGIQYLGEELISRLYEGEPMNHYFFIQDGTDEIDDTIVYIQSLDDTLYSKAKSYLFVQLNPNVWENISTDQQDNVFVVSFNNKHEVSSSPIPDSPNPAELTLTTPGSNSSVSYTLMFQNSHTIEKIKFIQAVIICSGVAAIAISILLVLHFTRKNYRPLLQLVKNLPSNITYEHENEYLILQQHLKDMADRNSSLTEELSQTSALAEDIYLRKLIQKHYSQDEFKAIAKLPLWQGRAENDDLNLALLIFSIDRPFLQAKSKTEEDLDLTIFVLNNILSDLIEPPLTWQSVYLNKELVVILHGDYADLNATCSSITSQMPPLLNAFNLKIQIGITVGCKPLIQISLLYKEAKSAAEYCHLYNTSYTYYQDSILRQTASAKNAHTIIHIQHRFQNILLAQDYDAAIQMIPELFTDSFPSDQPVSLLRLNMYSLINLYRSCLLELSKKNSYIVPLIDPQINKLLNCSSLRTLQDQFGLALLELSQKKSYFPASGQEALVDEIKEYIALHYSENTLSAGEIADHFGLSLPTISKMFKKSTQTGILDHIHHVRINQAKILLQSKQYTVNEVALMTGYLSPSTFIRVFKKYEGISPGTLINNTK